MDALEIKRHIKNLIDIQINLHYAFLQSWPKILDWKYFTDVPRNGSLSTKNGDLWTFRKHGTGLLFFNKNGVQVDFIEQFKEYPNAIDAYRLSVFLESLGYGFDGEKDSEEECESFLKEMMKINFIKKVDAFKSLYEILE